MVHDLIYWFLSELHGFVTYILPADFSIVRLLSILSTICRLLPHPSRLRDFSSHFYLAQYSLIKIHHGEELSLSRLCNFRFQLKARPKNRQAFYIPYL